MCCCSSGNSLEYFSSTVPAAVLLQQWKFLGIFHPGTATVTITISPLCKAMGEKESYVKVWISLFFPFPAAVLQRLLQRWKIPRNFQSGTATVTITISPLCKAMGKKESYVKVWISLFFPLPPYSTVVGALNKTGTCPNILYLSLSLSLSTAALLYLCV